MENKEKRYEELLYACINWIDCHIDSYSDMIEAFKRIGFTKEELTDFSIRDFGVEEDIDFDIGDYYGL